MAFQEIKLACRVLAKSPGFTAVAALSLALGIGANSAIFSLADALLLRPLPIRDPGAVVTVTTNTPDNPYSGVSYPNYRDFRGRSRSFDGITAFQLSTWGVAPSANEVAQMRMGLIVSDNFFQVLGVEPTLGRSFRPEETQVPGRDAVAVLAYDFWRTQFAADRSVIGRNIRLNGIDFNVVGVAPESFTGVDPYIRPALFVPVMMKQRLESSKDSPLEDRGNHNFTLKARLKPGVSLETARAELATIWNNLEQSYPDINRGRKADVKTEMQARYQQDPYDAILVMFLMGLVALVLIIACANVANLLLARANGRSREIAIRLAVGATRMRLIRQFLLESLVLALLGGLCGVGLSYVGIRFLQRVQVPTDLPVVISIQMDHRVLEFSLLAALVSALFFGLAPALQSTKANLVPALKAGGQGIQGRRRTIGRNILVVGQVALSMSLLVAAGMLVDAVGKTLKLDPGFRTDHLLMLETDTSLVRYTDDQTRDFYRTLRDRATELPGVRSVAMTCYVPFSPNGYGKTVVPEGYQFPKGQDSVSTSGAVIDEHFFDTMKMAVVRGRGFTAADKSDTPRVAVVNEEFAKTYWPKQDPIGKRFRLNDTKGPWVQVVGLTRTSRYYFIAEPPTKFLYLPFAQEQNSRMSLLVETYGEPAGIATPLRSVVRGIDPNQPIYNVRTFSSFYEARAVSVSLTIMQTVATMGLLGLTLALIGLYGLIAYSVSRRTKEIGIRMAIGANKTEVMRMILRQGFILAGAGILVGGAISVVVAQMLTIGLAGLGTPNPITYVVVPIALLLITLTACYIPARRASQIDPIRALRYE